MATGRSFLRHPSPPRHAPRPRRPEASLPRARSVGEARRVLITAGVRLLRDLGQQGFRTNTLYTGATLGRLWEFYQYTVISIKGVA